MSGLTVGESSHSVAPAVGTALLTWEEMTAEQDRRRLKREAASPNEQMEQPLK